MTSVFIESSALFRAYTREPGTALMDEIFLAMEAQKDYRTHLPVQCTRNPQRDCQEKELKGTH